LYINILLKNLKEDLTKNHYGYILIIQRSICLFILNINLKIMPNRDGTGPLGDGAGTGWGRGNCGANLRKGLNSARRRFFCKRQPTAIDLDAEEKLLKEELAEIANEKKALKDQK
jgi:hypothetical protein